MPVLEVTFDPSWAAARVIVDGGMWPSAVSSIRLVRSSASEGEVPVRGVERLSTVGGYWIGTDHELPIGEAVQYTVTGYNGAGAVVGTSSATITPAATERDLWFKAAGRPDMSRNLVFREVGSVSSDTKGGNYQLVNGDAVAQTSGSTTRAISGLVVGTVDAGDAGAFEALLDAARVLLIQHGGQPEFRPGWYLVNGWQRSNPAGKSYGLYSKRNYTLDLEATSRPAGLGVPATGVSWATVKQKHATWAALKAAVPTWFDLMKGA